MKTSIALIGFMGTGKTTVGKALAKELGKEFVELDDLIEKTAGKSITAIFRNDGEIRFRELEIEAVRGLVGKKDAVMACGGGVVLNKINIDRLAQESVIVCLTAAQKVILERTAGGEDRPLLGVDDRARQVNELLKFRQPYYMRAADITVSTSRLTVEGVVRRIIARIREHESFG